MASNKTVSYDIVLYNKSGSKEIAKTTGEASLKIIVFKSFEYIGTYPYFEMILYGIKYEDILNECDFQIAFNSEFYNYQVKICVLKKELNTSKNKILLIGKFAPSDLVLKASTCFLGDTSKTAIQALGFEQNLQLKNNINTKFYQRAETPINALEKICDCEADFPFWCIGITDIILTKSTVTKDYIHLSSIESIVEYSAPTFKISQNNIEETYYNVLANSYSVLGNIDNYESLSNVSLNSYIRKNYHPHLIMTGGFIGAFPEPVGTTMKNDFQMFSYVDFWTVLSVKITVEEGICNSYVQYGFWKNFIEG